LKKVLDNKASLPHSLTMKNEFALIAAESDLRDMIALSPMEIAEANAWFDMVSAQFDEIEEGWDRLVEYVDNL